MMLNTGAVLKELGLQVVHIHPARDILGDAAARNSSTVVFKPRKFDTHTIEVATAICSTNDTFSRKEGTGLALQHWLDGNRARLPARGVPQSDISLLKGYFG